jgi:ethanolamine ammonia-lyase small subunit
MSGLTRQQRELAAKLRAITQARVGLGRTGVSLETRDLLDFQLAHARARDAVHARLDARGLAATLAETTGAEVLRLHSAAQDRTAYLQRPDLGRRLDEASRALLAQKAVPEGCEIAVIAADGLSALAVERYAAPVVKMLLEKLEGFRLGPVFVVEQGRVAIGDEIGLMLGAELAVMLIGERPGLSSPDSMGAYITWMPRPGRTDAERNCISNIRAEGLTPEQAAAQLLDTVLAAKRQRLTGVALKAGRPLFENN